MLTNLIAQKETKAMLLSLVFVNLLIRAASGLLQHRIQNRTFVPDSNEPASVDELSNKLQSYLASSFESYVRSDVKFEPVLDHFSIWGTVIFRDDAGDNPIGFHVNSVHNAFDEIGTELKTFLLEQNGAITGVKVIRGRTFPTDGIPALRGRSREAAGRNLAMSSMGVNVGTAASQSQTSTQMFSMSKPNSPSTIPRPNKGTTPFFRPVFAHSLMPVVTTTDYPANPQPPFVSSSKPVPTYQSPTMPPSSKPTVAAPFTPIAVPVLAPSTNVGTDQPAIDPVEYSAVSAVKGCVDTITGHYLLRPGDFLCSASKSFFFGLALDGSFGLWKGARKVWSPASGFVGATEAALQVDGNLVVRSQNTVLWRSRTNGGTATNAMIAVDDKGTVTITNADADKTVSLAASILDACPSKIGGFVRLSPGEYICSSDDNYIFGVSAEGDLGLWNGTIHGPKKVWSAGTCCGSAFAQLQVDGNLVVRDGTQLLWESQTNGLGMGDAYILLSKTGIVTIVNKEPQKMLTINPNAAEIVTFAYSIVPELIVCIPQTATGLVELKSCQFICSPNGRFRFGVSCEGDLQLVDGSDVIWSGNTCCGHQDVRAILQQNDGNLVVFDAGLTPDVFDDIQNILWESDTAGAQNGDSALTLNDMGVAAIVNPSGDTVWSVAPPVSSVTIRPSLPPTRAPAAVPPVSATRPPYSTAENPVTCVSIASGQQVWLNAGDFVCSASSVYRFGVTTHGELGLFDSSLGAPVWSAGTFCGVNTINNTCDGVYAVLEEDGNLVVSSTSKVLWSSQTGGHGSCKAVVEVGNDGVATIFCATEGHIWSTATADKGVVDSYSLERKVMAGYQGWFFTEGDGGLNQWVHWGQPRTTPSQNTLSIDMWPNLDEFDDDELYPTALRFSDGRNAKLYSAYKTKTVERHCRWMQDYGIDGVFVQRFIREAVVWTPIVDKVLGNVRSGCEKYGRVFAVMYDVSNGADGTLVEQVINDWKHLVDGQNITQSGRYLRHKGKPLVAIWGLGFLDRDGGVASARTLITWFRNAPARYQATLLGGVPAGWRDLSRDSKTHADWAAVYRSFDVISPWAVGRMNSLRTADYFADNYIKPDLMECAELGIDYLPVVFPGYSALHLGHNRPLNQIPRNGGTFFWRQLFNAITAKSSMVYIAMFDEVDEGTAIFKVVERQDQLPVGVKLLSLDQDSGYAKVPSDWYLQLAGTAAEYLHSGEPFPADIPIQSDTKVK